MMTSQTVAVRNSGLLRNALRANAAFSGLSGLVLIVDARPLASLTGISAVLAFYVVGAFLIGFAAELVWVAGQRPISRTLAMVAIVADVLWVAASAVVLATGVLSLTQAGMWIVAILADVVAIFAIAQYLGLRRTGKSGQA